MKVQKVLEVMRPYATVVDAHGGDRLAAQMNALGDVWAKAMTWNFKDLVSRAWPKDTLPEADEASVQEFREAMLRLREVVAAIGKQDLVEDLSTLVAALEPHDREDLGSFVKACQVALEVAQASKIRRRPTAVAPSNPERVSEILRELKQSYKDAGQFEPIFQRLSNDESLSQADLAAIATGFAYETPARTKKPESLRRIRLVHESYATSAAKSAFSGGKSAA